MLKKLFKYFIAKHSDKGTAIGAEDIHLADRVFFAVFSRYGDGIISFKVIREFIEVNQSKRYLLFTTNQLVPYAKEILGGGIEVVGVNKRNPFSIIPSLVKLKRFNADLGFNPWSHGDDAEFFASFAKKYSIFKRFKQWDKAYNLYARVREYFGLESKLLGNVTTLFPKDAQNIILVPFSTDITKSLDRYMAKQVISKLKELYKNTKITICGFTNELKGINEIEKFYFSKSSSDEFLTLLKTCDLFVGVDAGPLHIANTLGIKSIGIFGPTAPETIVDFDWDIIVVRDGLLNEVFCCTVDCVYPGCIKNAISSFAASGPLFKAVEVKSSCLISEENKEKN